MTVDEISEEVVKLLVKKRSQWGWFQLTNAEYDYYGEARYDIEDLARAVVLVGNSALFGNVPVSSKYGALLIKHGFCSDGGKDRLCPTDRLTSLDELRKV